MMKKYLDFKFMVFKSILVIEKDKKTADEISNILDDKVSNLEIRSSLNDIKNINIYDLIIIDIDYFSVLSLSSLSLKIKSNIPLIYLTSEINEELLFFTNDNMIKNIVSKENHLKDLYIFIYLILKEKSKLNLGEDFYYCLQKDVLLKHDSDISLTKLESKFLKILATNKNRIVSYSQIEDFVWTKKNCTKYSMRNIVKKIRDKTHKSVIKNISGSGYRINTFEFE